MFICCMFCFSDVLQECFSCLCVLSVHPSVSSYVSNVLLIDPPLDMSIHLSLVFNFTSQFSDELVLHPGLPQGEL